MSCLEGAALDWLSAHHSTITDAALTAAGITLDQRKELVRAGLLARILDGVYSLGSVPVSEVMRCIAVGNRTGLVVSGPTAARHWSLRRAVRDDLIHVLAPPASQPTQAPWLRPYRTAALEERDVIRLPDGYDVTSPPRTVVDHSRVLGDDAVLSMVEDLLAKRYCTMDVLHRTAEPLATPGRPWAKRFLRLLERRPEGEPSESDPERDVYGALLAAGVGGLVRQHPMRLPKYGPARFDMAIPSLRWFLEVDIHPEHFTVEGRKRDRWRDQCAAEIDWAGRRLVQADLDDLPRTVTSVIETIEHRRHALRARRDER